MPREPELKTTRRRLPHWKLDGSVYFVTFRLVTKPLNAQERHLVLEHIKSGHDKFYCLVAAVVMPDHVHLILQPNPGMDLSRIMKGIKGVSARLLNQFRGTNGTVWQDESWDRILRDDAELDEKLNYMLHNPVKEGLVSDGWEYDGWFFNTRQTGMSAPPIPDMGQAGVFAPPNPHVGQTGMSAPPISGTSHVQ